MQVLDRWRRILILRTSCIIKQLRQNLNQLIHGRIKIAAVLGELLLDGHGGRI